MQYARKYENGTILLSVMMFIVIITSLALFILQSSVLENKMSIAYFSKISAFYKAENDLSKYEKRILDGGSVKGNIAQKLDDYGNCAGVEFYRITVAAKDESVKLQSTMAKLGDIAKCSPKPNIRPGRQSFRVVFPQKL